ncbi:MAG: NUDIX hydrolase [Candidatus Hadarchaeota archaeon]
MKKKPELSVDVVIKAREGVVLIKRRKNPFRGGWALPGGFVKYKERVEDAAVREVKEETGLEVGIERLVGVYSAPDRDPRGHTVTVCFLARPVGGRLKAGSDAAGARFFKKIPWRKVAFDHAKILKDAGFR